MDEKTLQKAVQDLCDEYGLLWHHCRDSRYCGGDSGLPDLIIVGRSVLWAELKSSTGRLKPEQRRWKYALEDAGQEYRLWTPRHLRDGTIAMTLEVVSHPAPLEPHRPLTRPRRGSCAINAEGR